MRRNRPNESGSRVRNVPIDIEPRDSDDDSFEQHFNIGDRFRGSQNNQQNTHEHERHFNYTPTEDNFRSNLQREHLTRTGRLTPPPYTSSVNVNYRPANLPKKPSNSNYSDRQQYSDRGTSCRSTDLDQQDDANNEESNNFEKNTSNNKENDYYYDSGQNDAPINRAKLNADKLVSSPEPIPLPPPPEMAHASDTPNKINDQPEQAKKTPRQQQPPPSQQNIKTESKKPKKESSPLIIINATRVEVNKLFQDIVKYSGLSTKEKEYVTIDEMLTRCTIRLDGIECGDSNELRLQRKSIIEIIDKCTDVLQRKVQLNYDIHQLSAATT